MGLFDNVNSGISKILPNMALYKDIQGYKMPAPATADANDPLLGKPCSEKGNVDVTSKEMSAGPSYSTFQSGLAHIKRQARPRAMASFLQSWSSPTIVYSCCIIFFLLASLTMLLPYLAVLTSLWSAKVVSAVTYTPFQPPSYPLAVRNPYLSAWIPGDLVDDLPNSRAQFWTGSPLIWTVIARIDGDTYNLFGVQAPESGTSSGTVVSAEFTATHSLFTLTAGGVEFSLDFFSPVTPGDYVRQSYPFSYLTVSILSYNGTAPSVQIYSDFDDSWNGQNENTWNQVSSWSKSTSGSAEVWEIFNENGIEYTEGGPISDMALWGHALYATQESSGSTLTSAAGPKTSMREAFVKNGTLSSLGDYTPNWASGGLAGFSHDLGTISGTPNVTFAIGYYRDCAINFLDECYVHYFRTEYSDPVPAIADFLSDYDYVYAISEELDADVQTIGVDAHSQEYADILSLAVRQTYGGVDQTLPTSLDTSQAKFFIKEISSDGNVNTLDIIFPAFPQFYVLDPEYIRLMLEPVVYYLEESNWNETYCIHDIGASYPNATGHPLMQEEKMPLEESGNIIQLVLAYTQLTGNTTFAELHQPLMKRYADYLADNGLYPADQLSATDAAGTGPNQTNLAIKSAVGMNAYGVLYDAENYTTTAKSYADIIYEVGTDANKTHFTFEYGDDDSWYITFNLFPDVLLGLDTFSQEAKDMQSAYYPTIRDSAGVAVASTLDWGKTEWQLWSAATCSDSTIDMFITDLYNYVSNGINSAPFSDRYFVTDDPGEMYSWRNRPVVGGEFVLAALKGTLSDLKAKRAEKRAGLVATSFEA